MFARPHSLLPLALFGALFVGLAAARAQEEKVDPKVEATKRLLQKAEEEYRTFFKRPETPLEYWAAMKFEIQLGKFDLAALHLSQLLGKPAEETKKDLVKLEAAEGLSAFLNLRKVKQWSDEPTLDKEAKENVEKLIDRVVEAVREHLGDPERLKKFIARLDAPTPEERAFAFDQLYRSKEQAVPYLIDALRANVGKSLGLRLHAALLRLDSSVVPAFLEVLKAHNAQDARDEFALRLVLLDVVNRRGDKRAVPYLWHLSAWEKYPRAVRARAKEVLANLLNADPNLLPPAKVALTQLANDYYYHRVRFPAGQPVKVRPWDGQQLAVKPVQLTPSQTEEFFGLRHAREALSLDADYRPAQVAFLNLTVERALRPDLDQALLKGLPANLKDLLVTIDADLVERVLEQAIDEHNVPVILGAVLALGERGEFRSARQPAGGQPRGLLRALYYPDRRVQLAAANALVRLPGTEAPLAADRIVTVYRRLLAGDGVPKALAAFVPAEKANPTRQALKAAGYEPVIAKDGKEAFLRLHDSADFDVVLLHQNLAPDQLSFVLAQLRNDTLVGELPVFVVADLDKQAELRKAVQKYRNVQVVPEGLLAMGDELKATLEEAVKNGGGAKLSEAERKEFVKVALDKLWRMARGELRGYDVTAAKDAVRVALRSPDAALLALETLGRLPGRDVQLTLIDVVTDPAKDKLRVPAGVELNRHIQKYGLLLDRQQDRAVLNRLIRAYNEAKDDPALRGQLAVALGAARPGTRPTGLQLFEYRPDLPPAPPMENGNEKKEKEKANP